MLIVLAALALPASAHGAPTPQRSRPPVTTLGALIQLPGLSGCLVDRASRQSSERYGTIVRNDLIDADMNRLVWWQSRGPELAEGQLVRLRGEVAKHTRFSGNAVTVITRCSPQTDHEAI